MTKEEENALVYTENDVNEIIKSISQPPIVEKRQINNLDPDILSILVDKNEFREGELLSARLKKIAAFYNKTVSLSNTRKEDFFHYRERIKDSKVVYMMSRRPNEFTWEEEQIWTDFQNWFEFELSRSENGFERITQATQIQQNFSEQKNLTPQSQGGGGLLSWGAKTLGLKR